LSSPLARSHRWKAAECSQLGHAAHDESRAQHGPQLRPCAPTKNLLRRTRRRAACSTGTDQRLIETHLNRAVTDDLRLRRLISVNQKGTLNRIGLNGEEVRTLVRDLVSGDSRLVCAASAHGNRELTASERYEVCREVLTSFETSKMHKLKEGKAFTAYDGDPDKDRRPEPHASGLRITADNWNSKRSGSTRPSAPALRDIQHLQSRAQRPRGKSLPAAALVTRRCKEPFT